MDYFALKHLHQLAVLVSLAGFLARGLAGLAGAAWVRSRPARVLPHIVDTVLLVSALMLAWVLKLSPGNAPWLLAKIIGLVVYIGLGVVALRATLPKPLRAAALVAALATAGWMVSVAITKHPLGFLQLA